METGLFVTFFEPGEAFEKELPPVGPLDHVVLGPRLLVAERPAVQQTQDAAVAIDRWLEAELELQRALGVEPGGPKRSQLRLTARDGVYLRFAVYGDARERDVVPELGPFAVVVVGRRSVEADGQMLATRAASELAPWELTSSAGTDIAGLRKPDIAFRAPGGAFHPALAAAPTRSAPQQQRPSAPVAEPRSRPQIVITPESTDTPPVPTPAHVPTPPIPAHVPPMPAAPLPDAHGPVERTHDEVAPAPIVARAEPITHALAEAEPITSASPEPEPPALTPTDLALIERIERERAEELLRARMQEEERRRLGVDEADESATTWAMRYRPQPANAAPAADDAAAEPAAMDVDWRQLLWQLRFALVGVLLLAVGAYGFMSFRGGTPFSLAGSGQTSYQTVGIAQKITGTRWEYVVNGVQRVPTAGTSRATGIYYVVRIGVTNRGSEGAQISPASFTLIDSKGTEYTPLGVSSGAYYGSGNTASQYIWPSSFTVGKTAAITVIFDVDPGLGRGNQLAIDELPRTRVSLD